MYTRFFLGGISAVTKITADFSAVKTYYELPHSTFPSLLNWMYEDAFVKIERTFMRGTKWPLHRGFFAGIRGLFLDRIKRKFYA